MKLNWKEGGWGWGVQTNRSILGEVWMSSGSTPRDCIIMNFQGEGGTPSCGLHWDMRPDMVWFLALQFSK